MNRGDLSDLNTFLAIADHLSFRAAAVQLGGNRSVTVRGSRTTTRSVSLTDAGLRLLERLRPGMQISNALEDLRSAAVLPGVCESILNRGA
jgi:DNA-binding transcriptional LysR family regulator